MGGEVMATGLGQSTPRLGIPKVNQNPQPPHLKQALAKRVVAKAPKLAQAKPLAPAPRPALAPARALASVSTPATATAQPSNTAATGSTTAASVAAPPAPAPVASSDPFAIPAYSPAAGQADPRDAAYWANLSKLQFNDRTEYGKDLQDQTVADSAYNEALQTAIQSRASQERALGGEAISHGLASSGWLDRTQGDQTRDYTQARANASLTKSQEDQARAAARTALAQGYGVEAAAELAAAATRYAENQAKVAEAGPPEAVPAAAAAATAGGGGAKPAAKVAVGNAKAFNPIRAALANRKKAR
jgi:hypothetical protein